MEANPCLDWTKTILFGKHPEGVTVRRKPENGGDYLYTTYAELEADFVSGKLHPGDLKATLTEYLNALLQPIRDHFATNPEAKKLLEQVRAYKTTR